MITQKSDGPGPGEARVGEAVRDGRRRRNASIAAAAAAAAAAAGAGAAAAAAAAAAGARLTLGAARLATAPRHVTGAVVGGQDVREVWQAVDRLPRHAPPLPSLLSLPPLPSLERERARLGWRVGVRGEAWPVRRVRAQRGAYRRAARL